MIIINRIPQLDCSLGVLNYLDFRCFTLEPPWLFNKPDVSCIPEGFYRVRKHDSPTHGDCLIVEAVTGRSWILVHAGNYVDNTQGCILVGEYIKDINGDGVPDVANSKTTLERLLDVLKYDSMTLEIR